MGELVSLVPPELRDLAIAGGGEPIGVGDSADPCAGHRPAAPIIPLFRPSEAYRRQLAGALFDHHLALMALADRISLVRARGGNPTILISAQARIHSRWRWTRERLRMVSAALGLPAPDSEHPGADVPPAAG